MRSENDTGEGTYVIQKRTQNIKCFPYKKVFKKWVLKFHISWTQLLGIHLDIWYSASNSLWHHQQYVGTTGCERFVFGKSMQGRFQV